MTSFLRLVRQHQAAAFFSLALALTWFAFIPFYLSNGDSIPWFTFGPMLSGLVVAALSGGWTSVKTILGEVAGISAMVSGGIRPAIRHAACLHPGQSAVRLGDAGLEQYSCCH
ncbi:hypothetical protein [Mesorhizobium sp. M1378]|uniref:hypothetical protein n=1 Tax=Mesorhizobium sp. M1378 TaxID=2957092 RepID=UPI003334E1CE